jgi:hypothetical protein
MKKVIKILIILVVLFIAFFFAPNVYKYFSRRIEINRFPSYYQNLGNQCLQKSSYGCCIASVRVMRSGNYKLSENGTCGDGFMPNMMKCIDSFKWCEPIKR